MTPDVPQHGAALAVWLVFAFLAGSAFGSFLNVCFWRIPRGESVVSTPSHCTTCGHKIAWFDNLPVFSFLVLRGRCRHCHTHYSARYFVMELLTAVLFCAFAFCVLGTRTTPPELLFPGSAALLFALCAGYFDWFFRTIPHQISGAALAAGVVLSALFPAVQGGNDVFSGALFSLTAAALFGGALALYGKIGKYCFRREIVGGGDVKMIAATAALLGWKGAFFVLLFASVAGTVAGTAIALFRHRKFREVQLPFGVFLAAGIALWCFAGKILAENPLFFCLR
ncbi:MAG: prepilin peptidase [Victivallaceae bacterium]|nr:prepilin peptidase [Victivallaceae bacterium]